MTLTGYWTLSGTSGRAFDYSGRENHGNLSGGVTQGAKGILGEDSHSFNGTDGRVRHDYRTSPSFTVNVWMRSSQSTWNVPGAGWSDRSASGFILHTEDNQSAWSGYILENTGNEFYRIGEHSVNKVNEWNMYTITHDNNTNTSKMFFNGKEVKSASTTTSRVENLNTATLGHDDMDFYSGTERALDGKITDARYYSRPITVSEIRYLCSVGNKGSGLTPIKSS